MTFEILEDIRDLQTIATGRGVRIRAWLKKSFGGRNWRKLKGVAKIRDARGNVYEAEIHWFEAHGVGRRLFKVKRALR